MAQGLINVVALVKVNTDKIGEGETIVKELAAQSSKEEGVAKYEIYRVVEKPGVYVFLEQFKSKEAIQAHRNSEHFKNAIQTAKDKEVFIEPPTIVTLEKEKLQL